MNRQVCFSPLLTQKPRDLGNLSPSSGLTSNHLDCSDTLLTATSHIIVIYLHAASFQKEQARLVLHEDNGDPVCHREIGHLGREGKGSQSGDGLRVLFPSSPLEMISQGHEPDFQHAEQEAEKRSPR